MGVMQVRRESTIHRTDMRLATTIAASRVEEQEEAVRAGGW
jgi:hypothetical protein